MNKIVFECRYFKIKVRDIVIVLGIIFFILMVFMVCFNQRENADKKNEPNIEEIISDDTDDSNGDRTKVDPSKKKELIKEKLNDVCGFTKTNINDFNYLLNRVNLCNADWFEDLDLFIKRIKEQNEILKDMTDKNSKDVYAHQEVWVKEIIKLKDEQSKENIESVEKVFKEYKKYYEKTCIKGNVGG